MITVLFQSLDSDIIEGPSRISLNCPIRYAVIFVAWVIFFLAYFVLNIISLFIILYL